nr:MAG TPA: Lsm2-8 spliceosome U6 Prp24-8 spliceosome U6 Prp24, SPLICING [Caudoviricetes sp.]
MKRSELEKYLGQKVEIKLFDGDILKGVLHKTGEEQFKDNLNLYLPQKRYFMTDDVGSCVSCMFRSSHVVLIREISDVRLEVKHGTWENTNTPNQLRCSNCEIIHFIAQYPHGEINYCPNCGARLKR